MPIAASLYGLTFGSTAPERPNSPVPVKRLYRPARPSSAPNPAGRSTALHPNGAATVPTSAHTPSNGSAIQHEAARRTAKASVVDAILAEDDLYKLLNVERTATLDGIRRGFLLRSRICHPDKFPNYPLATLAFQRISLAYETLSKPSSRRLYDITKRSDLVAADCDAVDVGGLQDETLNGVLRSVLHEFMEGDFEMIRVLIQALNEAPGWDLGEETVDQVEGVFQRLRTVVLSGQKYLTIVRFELVRLYDIQCGLRQLSYFDVFGRLRLTLQLARVTLGIPMAIDSAIISPDQHRPAGLGGPADAAPAMPSGSDADGESEASDEEGPPTPSGIGVDAGAGADRSKGFGIRHDVTEEAWHAEMKKRAQARKRAAHARQARAQRQPHGRLHEHPEEPQPAHGQPWGLLGPAGRGLLGVLVTTLEVAEQWIPRSSSTSTNEEDD